MNSKFDGLNLLETEVGNSIRADFLQDQINDEVGASLEIAGNRLLLKTKDGKKLSAVIINENMEDCLGYDIVD